MTFQTNSEYDYGMDYNIFFNKPYFTGKETDYICQAVSSGKISGNGDFTHKCQDFLQKRYGFHKCLLTSSCTDALEMAAILLNIKQGDEVIMPSYTFVSTANAFVLRGAKIVFCDSRTDYPGIDESEIERLITPNTKAIVVVHYAGIACEMDTIMALAEKHQLFVVEDAAQAIDSYYVSQNGDKRPLGSIGHLATFSFHETKNIISGEGGMLVINDAQFSKRAEIIWEKGTNRSAFFRGETKEYNWLDIGSSFLPSEITAAFLWAQLEKIDQIQARRSKIWEHYYSGLEEWARINAIKIPNIPDYATNNAHMFYLVCKDTTQREHIISVLREKGVLAIFHYLSLHKSPYYASKHDGRTLKESDNYANSLVRLPFYYELTDENIQFILKEITSITF